jgi:hypothetical protein
MMVVGTASVKVIQMVPYCHSSLKKAT